MTLLVAVPISQHFDLLFNLPVCLALVFIKLPPFSCLRASLPVLMTLLLLCLAQSGLYSLFNILFSC